MYIASEVGERFGVGPDAALARGVADRVKIQGRWLYFDVDDPDIEATLDDLAAALDAVLSEWLLNPAQYLVGQALRAAGSHDISHSACRLLIQELCQRRRLDGVALVSRSLQPYLAFFRRCDYAEIGRQIEAMRLLLAENGSVTWRELPDPERAVPRSVWRMTILAHGVWLKLGHQPERGLLEAW
jgi:hypothetical protein